MAGLARRIAPAAVLGGLAVVVVGVLDPALAARNDQTNDVPESAAQPATRQEAPREPVASAQQEQPRQVTPAQEQPVAADCSQGEQVAGAAAMTPWGPVQVVGTIAAGHLCEAHAVAWPNGDRKSQMINSYAIPELDAQMAQGGTQLDFVSGATYTSNGYAMSLQSILDQLR